MMMWIVQRQGRAFLYVFDGSDLVITIEITVGVLWERIEVTI